MNAVAGIAFYNAVSVRLNMLLNHVSDFAEPLARLHYSDCFHCRFISDLHQLLVFLFDFTNEESLVQISMKTVTTIDSYVQIAYISRLQWARVRYSVADNFVYACAARFRKLVVVQRARIAFAFDGSYE